MPEGSRVRREKHIKATDTVKALSIEDLQRMASYLTAHSPLVARVLHQYLDDALGNRRAEA